jgi:hypothetical protein
MQIHLRSMSAGVIQFSPAAVTILKCHEILQNLLLAFSIDLKLPTLSQYISFV